MAGSQHFYGAMPIFFRRSFRTVPALPERVSECGDVPLIEFVSDPFGAMPGPGPLMLLLCVQVRRIGVLKALPGAFMSAQVIFFSVVFGAGTMGMGGNVTVLGSYLLRFAHNRYQCTRGTVCRAGAGKGLAHRSRRGPWQPQVKHALPAAGLAQILTCRRK